MTTPARTERVALCDLLGEVGPDAPTCCAGWTARDLAAHLVVRDRRPDILPGMVVSAFAGHSERVRLAEAARPWPELVERLREGPPRWSPTRLAPVDSLVNSVEFFVHHEDVRRARPAWTVRPLPAELEQALRTPVRRLGPLLTRAAEVGLVLEPDGGPPIRLHTGEPDVVVRGPIGELALYVYGRKDVAAVTLHGPEDAVAQVGAARFGF